MRASAAVVSIGALGAGLDDGAGDAARMAFLAEQEDDVGEIALAGRGDDIGSARAVLRHPHVERAVETEREAALGLVELHRRHADIEHNAIDLVVAAFSRNGIEIGKAVFDQSQPALRLLHHIGPAGDGGLIAVDTDHLAVRGGENRRAVTAGAESTRQCRCRRRARSGIRAPARRAPARAGPHCRRSGMGGRAIPWLYGRRANDPANDCAPPS